MSTVTTTRVAGRIPGIGLVDTPLAFDEPLFLVPEGSLYQRTPKNEPLSLTCPPKVPFAMHQIDDMP
jgi:hypothetical protein